MRPPPAAKMDLKRQALEPPMGYTWLATNNPSSRPIIDSANLRGRRQGPKPFIFAAPLQAEQGVLNLVSDYQNLKLARAPPPAAGPCPKFPKIDHFLTSKSKWEKLGKLSKGEPRAPPNLKQIEKSAKVPVDVSFWMVLGKSLAARASQEAQRTKTGDEKSNPITPAQSKHSLHFSTKTLKFHRQRLRLYPFWTPYGNFGRQNPSTCLFGSVPEGV